jgi:hypothetical protein
MTAPRRQPEDATHIDNQATTTPLDRPGSNTQKDPDEWSTGDEPMTGAQQSYLKTLSDEAGEPFDDTLTKAAASKRIDELQRITGRGRESQEA